MGVRSDQENTLMFLVGYELPKLTEAIFENNVFDMYFEFLNIVPRPV